MSGTQHEFTIGASAEPLPNRLSDALVELFGSFSEFASVPTISSSDPNASATGEECLAFVEALVVSPPAASHPTAIERYV